MARVRIIKEARENSENDWNLCFQWCQYIYDDGRAEYGFRFIWRRPNGNLQGARGQARIESMPQIEKLVQIARNQGWAENTAENVIDR